MRATNLLQLCVAIMSIWTKTSEQFKNFQSLVEDIGGVLRQL